MGNFHRPVVYHCKLVLHIHLPDINWQDVLTDGTTAWSHWVLQPLFMCALVVYGCGKPYFYDEGGISSPIKFSLDELNL